MKSKAKHFYTLLNSNGREVQIDLANYKVTCTITGARKSFYHKYLAGLIERDYANNIDTFRTTYVSRAGRPSKTQAERITEQIERARARLNQLLHKQSRIESESTLTD
jgi:selenocysteine lyase/cysteine desulfurase